MASQKQKKGMFYITFPNDYKHLDHLGLGTE